MNWSAIDKYEAQKLRSMVVIDDFYQQASQDEKFLKLVVSGRDWNVHLIKMKHNLYQQTKFSKTIDLNISQLILFNNPKDVEQISSLGRQTGQRKLLLETYKKAILNIYGHLLTDMDSRADMKLEISTNCSGKRTINFFHSNQQNVRNCKKWVYETIICLICSNHSNQL